MVVALFLAGCGGGKVDQCALTDADCRDALGRGDWDGGDSPTDGAGELVVSPPGEPWNVLNLARLTSSEPIPMAPFPWPREAETAVPTVRDDWPTTGFEPLPGPAWVDLDLQPLGASGRLHRIEATFSKPPAGAVSVHLSPGCGEPEGETFSWGPPFEALELADFAAGCVRLEWTASAGERLEALRLESVEPHQDRAGGEADRAGGEADRAGGAFPLSGVVEGFYGVPWSWGERAAMVDLLSRSGMGLYIYAPKDDPLHRMQWRVPYPEDARARFQELAARASGAGVTLVFGISPFVDWKGEEDYPVLLDKVSAMVGLGFGGVALLADDIEFEIAGEVDGPLGSEHTEVANRLLADLSAGGAVGETPPFFLVPTVYSDERLALWEGAPDYLAEMASLEAGIEVMWTGPNTSDSDLSAADFEAVNGVIGRKVVLWDNFWANDGGDGFTGRILLAPYTGRNADLMDGVAGVVANPSIQGALSRLSVGTLAHYLAAPAPDGIGGTAMAVGMESGANGTGDEDSLEFVMRLFEGHANLLPGHRELENYLAELQGNLGKPASAIMPVVVKLLPLLVRMAAVESELAHSGVASDLTDELVYPLRKIRYEGEMGLYALMLLNSRMRGESGKEQAELAAAARKASAECRFVFGQDPVSSLVDAVSALGESALGSKPLVATDGEIPSCEAGETWAFKPLSGCAQGWIGGMPGATLEAGEIRFVPSHPGRYRLTVACIDGNAWGARIEEVVCRSH